MRWSGVTGCGRAVTLSIILSLSIAMLSVAATLLELVALRSSQPSAHELLPPLAAAGATPAPWPSNILASSEDNRQLVKLDGPGELAACLDGSPYAFWIWPGNSTDWSIFVNGGGWCLTEALCEARAATALGSSLGYNLSGAWDPPGPGAKVGGPPGYTCQGLDANCTRVFLPYCDGSCFTSHRDAPWPVNGTNTSLTFRGLANLDRTLDVLAQRFGLGDARRLVLQGGSAGGLSTYIHLDRVAERVKAAVGAVVHTSVQASEAGPESTVPVAMSSPTSTGLSPQPSVQVVGRPVAGFFIDELKFTPSQPSYADNIQYG